MGFSDNFYFQILENKVGCVVYNALDLYELADSVYALPATPSVVKERLKTIIETVDVDDNPYLFFGTMKKNKR